MRRSTLPLLLVLGLAISACTAGGTDREARVVPVAMFDDMSYDPEAFEFMAGDAITFDVSNKGDVRHEFFVGDSAAHQEHAAEMREAEHSDEAHADPAAVSVEPGASGMLTYTFEEAGELMVGCHEPGHYEAGMVAPITVHP